DRLAADAIGGVSEHDLAGNAEQADDAERPDADIRREADVEQKFGLVHLHRAVRNARARVQSIATQTGSTMLETGFAAEACGAASPSGSKLMSSGRLRSSR